MMSMSDGFREVKGVSRKGMGNVASPAVSRLPFGEILRRLEKNRAGRGF